MRKIIKILILATAFFSVSNNLIAADDTTTYNKEQLKQDYRAFLQQFKAMTAQYKDVTGEISKVMKEEGVPEIDLGDKPSTTTTVSSDKSIAVHNYRELGDGAYIRENDREIELMIDLPGYKRDATKISLQDGNKLLVTSKRQIDTFTRSYERTFELPVPADDRGTRASFVDGVLTIKIPKLATKQVSIPVR